MTVGKRDGPATFPRRCYAARSWDRSGQRWQWDGGELSMRTIKAVAPGGRVIPVLPPGYELSRAHAHQAWRTLAPLSAGRPSPFHRLFAGNQ